MQMHQNSLCFVLPQRQTWKSLLGNSLWNKKVYLYVYQQNCCCCRTPSLPGPDQPYPHLLATPLCPTQFCHHPALSVPSFHPLPPPPLSYLGQWISRTPLLCTGPVSGPEGSVSMLCWKLFCDCSKVCTTGGMLVLPAFQINKTGLLLICPSLYSSYGATQGVFCQPKAVTKVL